jgi:hypothetical protein
MPEKVRAKMKPKAKMKTKTKMNEIEDPPIRAARMRISEIEDPPARAVVRAESPVLPALDQANPWLTVSNSMGGSDGYSLSFMRFQKDGSWTVGPENETIARGTKVVVHARDIEIGHRKWENNFPIEREMGRIADGYVPKSRDELGDTDPSFWENNENGKPIDPWRPWVSVPTTIYKTHESYIFESGSRGGRNAIKKVVKLYGLRVQDVEGGDPGQLLVTLDADKYKHPNPTYGWIWYPILRKVGWIGRDGRVIPGTDGDDNNGGRSHARSD